MFKKLLSLFNRPTKANKNVLPSNEVVADLGSSSLKLHVKGKNITIGSSVREVSKTEIATQRNAITINNKHYIIGEGMSPHHNNKADNTLLPILLLFGLKEVCDFANDDLFNVSYLLPLAQIEDKEKIDKLIQGTYTITIDSIQYKVELQAGQTFIEGDTSLKYFSNENPTSKLVLNIGASTTDVVLQDSNGYRLATTSIKMGTRNIMVNLSQALNVRSGSVLNKQLLDGRTFTKAEEAKVNPIVKRFLYEIKDELINVLDLTLDSNTELILCGGGSLLVAGAKNEVFKGYKIVSTSNDEAIYSDLLGAVDMKRKEASTKLDERNKKILEMRQAGYSTKHISEQFGLSKSTVDNLLTKMKKVA